MSTAVIVSMALLPVVAYIVWIARMGEQYPIAREDRAAIWSVVGQLLVSVVGVCFLLVFGEAILNMLLGAHLWPARLLDDPPAPTWNWGPR